MEKEVGGVTLFDLISFDLIDEKLYLECVVNMHLPKYIGLHT